MILLSLTLHQKFEIPFNDNCAVSYKLYLLHHLQYSHTQHKVEMSGNYNLIQQLQVFIFEY